MDVTTTATSATADVTKNASYTFTLTATRGGWSADSTPVTVVIPANC